MSVPAEGTATEKQIASPIKFKNAKASYLFTGKKLGEDSEAILKAHNYSEEKIQVLKEKGVFGVVNQ